MAESREMKQLSPVFAAVLSAALRTTGIKHGDIELLNQAERISLHSQSGAKLQQQLVFDFWQPIRRRLGRHDSYYFFDFFLSIVIVGRNANCSVSYTSIDAVLVKTRI